MWKDSEGLGLTAIFCSLTTAHSMYLFMIILEFCFYSTQEIQDYIYFATPGTRSQTYMLSMLPRGVPCVLKEEYQYSLFINASEFSDRHTNT